MLLPCQTIQNYTEHIWRLTNQYNVLQPREWKERVSDVMLDYQLEVIDNVRSGYVGNLPGKLCNICVSPIIEMCLRLELFHFSCPRREGVDSEQLPDVLADNLYNHRLWKPHPQDSSW